MRHNLEKLSLCNTIRTLRWPAILISLLCVIFLSAGDLYSQAHKAGPKADKKTSVEKKKAVKAVKEPKKEKVEEAGESTDKESKTAAKEPAEKTGDKTSADDTDKTGLPTREYGDNDFRPQAEEESTVWLLFKTILVLGSIVGGFYFFFKFVTKKTGMQLFGQEVVKVLSVIPLGQNKYIQVVDLAGKVLVLGITDSSINVLSEVKEKDEIDRLRLLSSRTGVQKPGGFQEYLTGQIGKVITRVSDFRHRGHRTSVAEETDSTDLSYLRAHKKRLHDLNGNGNEKD